MKRVLLVCPSGWDEAQLARSRERWSGQYELIFIGQEAEDCPATFDALACIDQTVETYRHQRIDGVASSSDYPGCIVAAAITQGLGLPGPAPQAVLTCAHKYYALRALRTAVPEATPRFALVDAGRLGRIGLAGDLGQGRLADTGVTLDLPFPLFVKPVKSWFSVLAERMDTPDELAAFATRPDVRAHLTEFVTPFNQLIRRYTDFVYDGGYLLAEELLRGDQVTVEGFVFQGEVQILGIADSVMYPGTQSFQRFDLPSALDEGVQARMANVAARVMRRIGFDEGLFNVEMFYDAKADTIRIIEINPRMCGQFADLMESVNGTNTYEILLALACGERPKGGVRRGRHAMAASFPMRVFGDRRVVRAPSAATLAAVTREYPVTLLKSFYTTGQRLSDRDDQLDGSSYRYAVVNMAAEGKAALLDAFAGVEQRLGFEFEEVA